MTKLKPIVIVNNLVNDFCGIHKDFLEKSVNIGLEEIERLLGIGRKYGEGPLASFLLNQNSSYNILFIRNSFQIDNKHHKQYLDTTGEYCIENSEGIRFPEFISDIIQNDNYINTHGIGFDLHSFRNYILSKYDIDIFVETEQIRNLKILLVGFHTERSILNNAITLRSLLKTENIAVFSHFLSSTNREAHYDSLRYQFPNSFVRVINSAQELEKFLGDKFEFLNDFDLSSVDIKPAKIARGLGNTRRKIIESICMHWTDVELKALGGGYSGSALFIAKGRQKNSATEPMVIKIDSHYPIMKEVRGYNLVKDFLGKHIPAFTLPISRGKYSGIGMELAAMEGNPITLQEVLEDADDDIKLYKFLELQHKILIILKTRIYSNTLRSKPIAPFKHYLLHISDQTYYLERNLKNLKRHPVPGMVVSDQITINLFNTVRKNNDAINTDQCIGHGDLNFANIILDEQKNIWTIDWTYASYHPLEIDFAKMENDIKFIISKEINIDDLEKLQLMEEFMLENLELPDINLLPEHLKFISWDIRFKKIYLPVKKLRDTYLSIKVNAEWLVYKISLLRYSLHTLSFDRSLDKGECSPAQLWFAYISSESILFQLMADDYHLKIRSEKPDNYPERFRIQIDQSNWNVECQSYSPPEYSEEKKSEYADPLDKWNFDNIIKWGRSFNKDSNNGRPLNPVGRTGISGKGSLPYWGNNPIRILIPIRYDHGTKQFYYLINRDSSTNEFISIFYRRDDNDDSALKRLQSSIPEIVRGFSKVLLHKGYIYDPRETDNAWIEAWADMVYIPDTADFSTLEKDEFIWKELDYHDINLMNSGSSTLIRATIQKLLEHYTPDNITLKEILRKTG